MTMSLNEALMRHEPRVGAWDYKSAGHRTLRVYAVGLSGAKLLAVEEVADDAREDTNDRLRRRNVRVGGTHRDQQYVWVFDEKGAAIWSETALVAQGTSTELGVGKASVQRAQVVTIETFFDKNDIGHRGVRCVRKDGGALVVVEERDESPKLDPTYDAGNLEADIEWAYYLGQDLSLWLDVPHHDQVTDDVTNAWMRTVAAGCRALAPKAEQAPVRGSFEHIDEPIGAFGECSDLSLRFAPNPLEPEKRFLEVRVTSKSAKTTSGRWVKQGTNEDVASFLRRVRTPHLILTTMQSLLESQKRDGYA